MIEKLRPSPIRCKQCGYKRFRVHRFIRITGKGEVKYFWWSCMACDNRYQRRHKLLRKAEALRTVGQ